MGVDGYLVSVSVGLRRRIVALALVCCCVAPLAVGTRSAGADDVADLNARADRIAQRLVGLQQRIAEIGEQFNQSQVRKAQLAKSRADIERRSRAARLEVAARRADASRYALSAYVGQDEGDPLALALDGRQWDLSRRSGYAAIRIGNRQQIVDDLQAAEQTNHDLIDALDEATAAQKKVTDDLERQQAEASKLIARQQSLQDSVTGELAQAVARRQAELRAASTASGSNPVSSTPGGGTTPAGPGGATPASAGAGGAGTPGGGGTGTPGRPSRPAGPAPTTGSAQPPATAPPVTAPPATSPPPIAPPAPSGRGQVAANAAISQLGVRYSWGGGNASGPSMGFGPGAGIVGFDCSGLTLYAWAQAGVSLYHSAQVQYNDSAHVSLSQLQPGDLVFYGSSATSIDHVAIYVGGGQVVHAPNHTTVVQYGPVHLWPGYFAWIGAGRPG